MSVKFFVRNSGAGNGCANFMGAWRKCVLSAGKIHVRKIPPVRVFFLGGGECRFYFYGREDLSDYYKNRSPRITVRNFQAIWRPRNPSERTTFFKESCTSFANIFPFKNYPEGPVRHLFAAG